MADNSSSSSSLGFLSILGLIFIVLKLTHYINWSWWFVLMPLYIGIPIILIFLIIFVIFISKK